MKVRLLSDLHIEFAEFNYEYLGEAVVVLAGDIHTKCRHAELLDQIPESVIVVLVAGNHEYYNGIFEFVNSDLKKLEYDYPNLVVLQNSRVIIGGIEFFGGTMFTDFQYHCESNSPLAKFHANCISDFSLIAKFDKSQQYRQANEWTQDDHVEQHKISKKELNKFLLDTNGKNE